jgi:hypothetical protein
MVASRWASIDLPVPREPIISPSRSLLRPTGFEHLRPRLSALERRSARPARQEAYDARRLALPVGPWLV